MMKWKTRITINPLCVFSVYLNILTKARYWTVQAVPFKVKAVGFALVPV
jgi:hypothetical protein